MRIEIDWDACAGTGMCAGFAPSVFALDDEGSLTLLDDQPAEDLRDEVVAAELACPTRAITVVG